MSLPLPVTSGRSSSVNYGFATKQPLPTTFATIASAFLSGLAALGQAASTPFILLFSTCRRRKSPSANLERASYTQKSISPSFTSPAHHIPLPTPPKPVFLPSLTIFRPKPTVKPEADVTIKVRTIWSAKVLSAIIKSNSDILDTLFEVVDKEHGYVGELVCYHAAAEDVHPLLTDRAVRWWLRFVGSPTQPECWVVPSDYNPQDLYTRTIEVRYHQESDTNEAWWETQDGKRMYNQPRRLSFSSLSIDESFKFPQLADNDSIASSHHSKAGDYLPSAHIAHNSTASSVAISVPVAPAQNSHDESDLSSPESLLSNDPFLPNPSPVETLATLSPSRVNEAKEGEGYDKQGPELDNALRLTTYEGAEDDDSRWVVVHIDTWQGTLRTHVTTSATVYELSAAVLKQLGLSGGFIQLWIWHQGRWVYAKDNDKLQAWLTSEQEDGWRAKVLGREEGSDKILRPRGDDSDGMKGTDTVSEAVHRIADAPNEEHFARVLVETWAGEVAMEVPIDTTVRGLLRAVGRRLEWTGTAALNIAQEGDWVYMLRDDEVFQKWLQAGPGQDGEVLRAQIIRPQDLELEEVEGEEEDLQEQEKLDCYALTVATWKGPLEFNAPYGSSFNRVLSAITSYLDESLPVLLFAVDQDGSFTPILDESSFKALAPRGIHDSRQFDCRAIPASAPCLQGDSAYIVYPDQASLRAWLWSIRPEEDDPPMRPNEQDIYAAEVKAGFRDDTGDLVESCDLNTLINFCGWQQ